jgi:hypothetical protein
MEKQSDGKDIYKHLGEVISAEVVTAFTLYSSHLYIEDDATEIYTEKVFHKKTSMVNLHARFRKSFTRKNCLNPWKAIVNLTGKLYNDMLIMIVISKKTKSKSLGRSRSHGNF